MNSKPKTQNSTPDALLLLSFGGPEGQDEVIPFLEGIVGNRVPRARLETVAEHYWLFGGVSPINTQNRALIAALTEDFAAHGMDLPIYFGNRHWKPFVKDTLRQMMANGVKRAVVFITAAYDSYVSYQLYLDELVRAQTEIGAEEIQFTPLPVFFNQSGFIDPNIEHVRAALAQLPNEAHIAFTAHSIPVDMAEKSPYVAQLTHVAQKIAGAVGNENWRLVYQSRSGNPRQPWLEPDINDHLETLKAAGVQHVVIAPIGFISDHMEVVYDLDTVAKQKAAELGLTLVRAKTVGTHPAFVAMIRELVEKTTGK